MPKRPPKHWFKRCVKAVKKRSPQVTNPAAICGNNWHNRMSAKAKKKALREEKKLLAKHEKSDGLLDQISDFLSKVTGRTKARKARKVITSVKVCKKVYLAKFPGPQKFQLAKNLKAKTAYAIMRKRARRDFRGYWYDPKTGKGQLI